MPFPEMNTAKAASFAFRLIFPNDKIDTRQDSVGKYVYFNDEASPRYSGSDETWTEVYARAYNDLLQVQQAQQTVQ